MDRSIYGILLSELISHNTDTVNMLNVLQEGSRHYYVLPKALKFHVIRKFVMQHAETRLLSLKQDAKLLYYLTKVCVFSFLYDLIRCMFLGHTNLKLRLLVNTIAKSLNQEQSS